MSSEPTQPAVSSREIHLGPTWTVLVAAGVLTNFAGIWIWLGLGRALFITGALTVTLAWGSVIVLFRLSLAAARR